MDYQYFLLNLCDIILANDTGADDELFAKLTMEFGGPSFLSVNRLKDRGNALFREGNISTAHHHYKLALEFLCFLGLPPLSEQPQAISCAISSILNLAFCELKLKNYAKVLMYCTFILTFEPSNAKALYRRGLASKHMHSLTEALKDFELASKLDPNNKDITRELLWVVDELALNPNGKRVVDSFDPLGSNKKGKRPDASYGVTTSNWKRGLIVSDELDTEKKQNQPLQYPTSFVDGVADRPSDVPMDYKSGSFPDENAQVTDDLHSLTNSKSPLHTFTNLKLPHNKLSISTQDYEKLQQGKNLGFFNQKSLSFMRVRTLTSKTIRMGTPQEDISGSAEVPLSSSPSQERDELSVLTLGNVDKVVREEVLLKVAKKQRVTSGSAQLSETSAVCFQFTAVGEIRKRDCKRKGGYSLYHNHETRLTNHRKRSLVSFNYSFSFCRFLKEDAAVTRAKRKEVSFVHFDHHYHRPKKKYKCFMSVSSSCNVSNVNFVSCFSSTHSDSGIRGLCCK